MAYIDPALADDLRGCVQTLADAEFAAMTTQLAPCDLLAVTSDVRERIECALMVRGLAP